MLKIIIIIIIIITIIILLNVKDNDNNNDNNNNDDNDSEIPWSNCTIILLPSLENFIINTNGDGNDIKDSMMLILLLVTPEVMLYIFDEAGSPMLSLYILVKVTLIV